MMITTDRVTLPENPFRLVRVTMELPAVPVWRTIDEGFVDMLKLGGAPRIIVRIREE